MCQESTGKGFAKQLAVNHVVLMVMRSGSNYWPGAVCWSLFRDLVLDPCLLY